MASARPFFDQGKIYIAIQHKRVRTLYSTGFKVAARHWNSNGKEVRKSHPDHRTINNRLAELVQQAQSLITEQIAAGREPEPLRVKMAMGGRTPVSVLTFTAYAQTLLDAYKSRGQISTWKAYLTAHKKLKEFAGDVTFEDVTPAFLRSFQSWLIQKKKNRTNTIHKNMGSLRTMWAQARKEGLTDRSPFAAITLSKEAAIKAKLTMEEVRQLAAAELTGLEDLVRDAWMFSFYAGGMRFGDVATMQRKHLQVSGGEVRSFYRMGKTSGLHGVLLVPRAVAILDKYGWKEKSPEDLLFPLLKGYDLSTAMKRHLAISTRNAIANKYLKKIAKKAKVETRLTFHLSRHSLGGYLLEQGYDVYTIRDILGHSSVRQTEHYLRGFKGRGSDDAMRDIDI